MTEPKKPRRKPGPKPGGPSSNPAGRPKDDFKSFLNFGFKKFKTQRVYELQNAPYDLSYAERAELQRLLESSDGMDLLHHAIHAGLAAGSEQITKAVMERTHGKLRTPAVKLSRPDLTDTEEVARRLTKEMLAGNLDPTSVKTAIEVLKAIGEIKLDAAATRQLEHQNEAFERGEE